MWDDLRFSSAAKQQREVYLRGCRRPPARVRRHIHGARVNQRKAQHFILSGVDATSGYVPVAIGGVPQGFGRLGSRVVGATAGTHTTDKALAAHGIMHAQRRTCRRQRRVTPECSAQAGRGRAGPSTGPPRRRAEARQRRAPEQGFHPGCGALPCAMTNTYIPWQNAAKIRSAAHTPGRSCPGAMLARLGVSARQHGAPPRSAVLVQTRGGLRVSAPPLGAPPFCGVHCEWEALRATRAPVKLLPCVLSAAAAARAHRARAPVSGARGTRPTPRGTASPPHSSLRVAMWPARLLLTSRFCACARCATVRRLWLRSVHSRRGLRGPIGLGASVFVLAPSGAPFCEPAFCMEWPSVRACAHASGVPNVAAASVQPCAHAAGADRTAAAGGSYACCEP